MIEPRLEETGRGLTVFSGSRYLYSRHSPCSRPQKIAQDVKPEPRILYFVPSPLLGYGIQELCEHISPDSHILALEYSQKLMALCAPQVEQKLLQNPNITWIRASENAAIHQQLKELGPWKFRRIQRLDLNAGSTLFSDKYQALFEFMTADLAAYWRNRYALGRLGRDWVRHIYANLAAISQNNQDFRSLDELRVELPIVVVGAGPSMESSINWLKQKRNKIWIMSVDTALRGLLDTGIVPDAVLALETQAWNMLDFHNSAQLGLPVIADLSSYPPSLTHSGATCYLYSTNFAEIDFLDRLHSSELRPCPMPPLGSVGVTAVEIALRIGSGPVFLSGLDFAYSPGKTHARGTAPHIWELSITHRLNRGLSWISSIRRPRTKAKDTGGVEIPSDSILQGYANLLRDRLDGNANCAVLVNGGIDLGIPVLDEKQATQLLESCFASKNSYEDSCAESSAASQWNPASAAARFLESETRNLTRVINAWNRYESDETDSDDLMSTLILCDQLYVDFPDQPPLPNDDDAFLFRAAARARGLLRYIERVAER